MSGTRLPEDYELLARLREMAAIVEYGQSFKGFANTVEAEREHWRKQEIAKGAPALLSEAADALELAWKLLDQRNDEDERRFFGETPFLASRSDGIKKRFATEAEARAWLGME